jgi:hypothetical protein
MAHAISFWKKPLRMRFGWGKVEKRAILQKACPEFNSFLLFARG